MRKAASVLVIITLVVLNFNLLKSSLSSANKLADINKESLKLLTLEKQNQNLKDQLTERGSQFFIEQEARNKLGFGKSGETTIVVENQVLSSTQANKDNKTIVNWEKWLNLFRN